MNNTNKKYRSSRNYPVAIGRIINPIIKPIYKEYGTGLPEIEESWKHVIGEKYFKSTKPKQIKWINSSNSSKNKKIGILVILAYGPISLEVQYLNDIIINKVNNIYGYEIIKKIQVIQVNDLKLEIESNKKAPLEANDLSEFNSIKNINLKKALSRIKALTK
ncbi:MAG: DciA family protein [Alphaproteobacteria bacterium]|jgi:hypothetical protein|tara:strand:- start:7459 stop:7944 length:486 start_codon:yes stop_codon:yes gene_type:complete